MNLSVFLGAPGSGKGTQAKRLSSNFGQVHFSTGDMLRAAIKANSDLGKRAKSFIDKGDLVPDDLMIELIAHSLEGVPKNSKVILDGFPRTMAQAEALDKNQATQVNKAIYFKMEEPSLIRRLTGRRLCENCGEPYHVDFMPPKIPGRCDKCNGNLIQRNDDSESVVKNRLDVFRRQNDQLLSYYRKRAILAELEADKPVETIQKNLIQLLS